MNILIPPQLLLGIATQECSREKRVASVRDTEGGNFMQTNRESI
jgi:hypothetical protein